MLNSPFGSFHNTVAEAKREREQLDRLLTISTPRERLLVSGTAVLLFLLAVWLFLGNVGRSLAVDGVLVKPGENLPGGNPSVQALIWVASDVAPHLKAGMPAVIELGLADGGAGTLEGTVATVSVVPLSGGLAAIESAAPVSVHRVDIALDTSLDFASLASRECRIVIELDRQSPVALLRMRQS